MKKKWHRSTFPDDTYSDGRATDTERTEFLTVADVAGTLKVSRNKVYRLVANGQLAAVKLGTGPNPPIRIPALAQQPPGEAAVPSC
jgi:excisionase family DNA binding protein